MTGDCRESPPRLIGVGDPAPFEVIAGDTGSRLMLICDHADRAIPHTLGSLGLSKDALSRHIAYDIGAARLTERLAARFASPAVLCRYSRLVIDPNRRIDDPSSILAISDGVPVPGNHGIGGVGRRARVGEIYEPYHAAVETELAAFRERGAVPAVVSVHSCTPAIQGFERPWHVGVLWNRDPRLAKPLIAALNERDSLCVGDNQPYSGRDHTNYSIETHAARRGYPHVVLEVRQDLIADDYGVEEWGTLVGDALADVLSDDGLYREEIFR